MIATKKTGQPTTLFAHPLFWMAVIALATFVAYLPALRGNFTNWDDMVYIGGNPYIQSLSPENIAAIFSSNYMGNYHPLAMLSLTIDYQINGLDPRVFHFNNLLLHILNALLVMVLFRRLTGKLDLAVIAGLLFGVHALHVESVAWISERKDVLYSFFYLLSLVAYVRFAGTKHFKWYIASLILFVLSCLSKGQAVTLAVTLLLIDLFLGRKLSDIKVLAEKAPFFILALIFGFVAIKAQQGADATAMTNFPMQQRIAFASYGLVMYILKLFLPVSLSAYYPYPILGGVGEVSLKYWLSIVPALAFLVSLYVAWKRSKTLFFGLAFFFFNILTLLQLLPVGRAIMADRYAYIPSIGFVFLAGFYLTDRKLVRKEYLGWALAGVYALLLMFLTFQRSKVWQDSETLWSDAIAKNPRVPVAWYNRGNVHMDSLDYKAAIADYTECLKLDPSFWKAYINRGTARNKLKDYINAIPDFDAMLRIDSTSSTAYINRGLARRMLKDYENALSDYNSAIRLKPDQPELFASRANLKMDMKDYAGAIADLDRAVEMNPNYATGYTNRAVVKKASNDLQGALADYNAAIAIDGNNSEFFNNRGNLRFQLKDYSGAIDDYTASIRISPAEALGYKNRAAAYLEMKQFDAALADLGECLRIEPKSGEYHFTRAMVKKAMNDPEGAKADYRTAVELDPAYAAEGYLKSIGIGRSELPSLSAEQLNEQALLLEKQGKIADAIDLYQKAVAIKSDFPEAWFNLGNAYGKTSRIKEAMDCLNNAIRHKPDYAEALSSRGIAYASTGKTDLAIKDLTAAIRSKPDFAMAYYNRAMVYLNTRQKALACADLQKAVSMGYNPAYPALKKECEGK